MTQRTVNPNTVPTQERAGGDRHNGDSAVHVTKSLLGYGVLAGVVYEVVAVAQGLTRPGFDFTRHSWSLLATGSLGWIQITNFVVAGAMTIAFAVGVGRAFRANTRSRWVPRLIGGYGLGLVAAGVFRADPALGFPHGTPEDAHDVSWHGMLHLTFGGLGFLCLVAACMVVARRFATEGRSAWAWYSRATGVLFLAGFACVATGATAPWATLGFVAAVAIAWAWVAALAVHLYRQAATSVACRG